MKTLPNFFIVGAPRCGTTSLDAYISQHPEIYVTPHKETHYFADAGFPTAFTGPGDDRLNRLLIRDEGPYASLFDGVTGAKAVGESSASYICFPGTAARIAQSVPHAKIIILLREPVDRAYSAYKFLYGRETLPFEEGLAREQERKLRGFEPMWWYRDVGLYYPEVKRFMEVFGAKQVKVLLYEDLFSNLQRRLRDVFSFLGVREDITIDTSTRYNGMGVPRWERIYGQLDRFIYNPSPPEKFLKSLLPYSFRKEWASKLIGMLTHQVPMADRVQDQLKASFAEDVWRLEELLHQDLHWWQYDQRNLAQQA